MVEYFLFFLFYIFLNVDSKFIIEVKICFENSELNLCIKVLLSCYKIILLFILTLIIIIQQLNNGNKIFKVNYKIYQVY